MHLFLNAYGHALAPLAAFAPAIYTRDAANTTTPRVAIRTDGASGFIFVNNYVRQLSMPARAGFQVKIKLPKTELSIPTKPVNIPPNTYFAWPFHLALGAATLNYSTSQLLTHLATAQGDLIVFYAIPGIAPELSFNPRHIKKLSAPNAKIVRSKSSISGSGLVPGLNSTIELTDERGRKITLLLLTKDQAEQTTVLRVANADHLVLSASSVIFDGSRLRLRSTTSPTQSVSFLPDVSLPSGTAKHHGLWTNYTFTQPSRHFDLDVRQVQGAQPRKEMEMGPYVDWRKASVPTVPPAATFSQAATWHIAWKAADVTGLSQLLLQVRYFGDTARLSAGEELLDDNFFNGLPWDVGIKPNEVQRITQALYLRILPLPSNAPIYLDSAARVSLSTTGNNPLLKALELIPEYEASIMVLP